MGPSGVAVRLDKFRSADLECSIEREKRRDGQRGRQRGRERPNAESLCLRLDCSPVTLLPGRRLKEKGRRIYGRNRRRKNHEAFKWPFAYCRGFSRRLHETGFYYVFYHWSPALTGHLCHSTSRRKVSRDSRPPPSPRPSRSSLETGRKQVPAKVKQFCDYRRLPTVPRTLGPLLIHSSLLFSSFFSCF